MDANAIEKLTRDLLYVTEQMRIAQKTISVHDKMLFGDREKPDEYPGMVNEWREARHAAKRAEELTAGNRKIQFGILIALMPGVIEFALHMSKLIKP